MNFKLKQEHKLIQKTARDFAKNELLPKVLYRDENKIWPKDAIKKMADLGFLGIMVDNLVLKKLIKFSFQGTTPFNCNEWICYDGTVKLCIV